MKELVFCSKTFPGTRMSTPEEKEKPRATLGERTVALVQSLSLTADERLLVLAVLVSLLTGAATMHWRRQYLLDHPGATESPSSGKKPLFENAAGD